MIEGDEDVVEAGEERLTRNIYWLLALLGYALSSLKPVVEASRYVIKEEITTALDLVVHAFGTSWPRCAANAEHLQGTFQTLAQATPPGCLRG